MRIYILVVMRIFILVRHWLYILMLLAFHYSHVGLRRLEEEKNVFGKGKKCVNSQNYL